MSFSRELLNNITVFAEFYNLPYTLSPHLYFAFQDTCSLKYLLEWHKFSNSYPSCVPVLNMRGSSVTL